MDPWYAWTPWGGEFWFARLLVQRGVALTYLVAFLAIARQFRPLAGEEGLQPIEPLVERTSLRERPSVFQFAPSDLALGAGAWLGVACSVLALVGVPGRVGALAYVAVWATLWVLFLSFVNVGQTFTEQGYEPLLCESGFLAIFLGPSALLAPGVVVYLFRWVAFRNMFGAGLAKLRGDDCWRDLSCMDDHYESQPIPSPLAWVVRRLPDSFHRASVLGNHIVELLVPVLYFGPPRLAAAAGVLTVVFQGWLLLTGNFAFLNLLSIAIAGSLFADGVVEAALGVRAPADLVGFPTWLQAGVAGAVVLVVALSYYPVVNMAWGRWISNGVLDPFKLVNSYGAFGQIRDDRYELVVQGTSDEEITPDTEWRTYEFYGKPTDPERPPAYSPAYPLMLDSVMWWASATRSASDVPWFERFVQKLLDGDEETLSLVRENPFDEPPRHVRVLRYRYEFTTVEEWRETGRWWSRERVGTYLGPVSPDDLD